MTGPTSGYPDWQPYASWRGGLALFQTFTIGAGVLQDLAEFSMGNYASLRINLEGLANGVEVRIYGEDDQFGTAEFLIERWVVTPNTIIRAVIPCVASWIRVEALGAAGTGGQFSIMCQPHNIAINRAFYFGSNSTLSIQGRAIAAGVTDIWFPNILFAGPAHLWFTDTTGAAGMLANIFTYDSSVVNTDRIVEFRDPSLSDLRGEFILPAKPWKLQVNNGTGAAQTYWITIQSQGTVT